MEKIESGLPFALSLIYELPYLVSCFTWGKSQAWVANRVERGVSIVWGSFGCFSNAAFHICLCGTFFQRRSGPES